MARRRKTHPARKTEHPGIKDFRGKKIIIASQINVKRLEPYMDRVLDAIGHPEALVTDESRLSDFASCDPHPDARKTYQDELELQVTTVLGIPVYRGEYLWKIAERLAEKEQT